MKLRQPPSSVHFFLIIGLLCFLLYGQVFVFDYALYFRDIYHNYHPFLSFIGKSLQQGQLPLWNPYVFAGTPQLATMEPPVFYPPGWIFFVGLPFAQALVLNLILHHLLAAGGIYLLGRSYGWSWYTRTLCACLFTFSGVMVSMNNFHPLQNTVAWLPLVFWAFHELLQKPRLRPLLAFALVYGLQILSGHLEIVYFETLLMLAYGLVWFRSLTAPWRALGLSLAAMALALGLSAIQLLPAFFFVPSSVRQLGVGTDAVIWSFHPVLSLLLLLPEQAGNIFEAASLNTIFGEASFGYTLFFLSVYLGLLTWIPALAGMTLLKKLQQRREYLFFSSVFVLCLGLAWGKFSPLYQALLLLPGASFFRYPSKMLVFASLALVLAAGCVIEQVLRQPELARRLSLTAASLAGLSLATWLLLQISGEAGLQMIQHQVQSLRQDVTPENALRWAGFFSHFFRQQLLIFMLLALLFAGLWLLYLRQRERKVQVLGLLLLAANLDLLGSGINSVWMSERDLFEKPSEVTRELLQRGLDKRPQERLMMAAPHESIPDSFAPEIVKMVNFRISYFQPRAMVNNYSLTYGLRNLYGLWPGRSAASNQAYVLYEQAAAQKQADYRRNYEILGSARYILTINPPPALLALYSEQPGYRLLKDFPDVKTTLWENLDWLPRVRFQYQAMTVKSRELMVTAMAQPKITGFDSRKQVLLLDDAQLAQARTLVPASEASTKRWSPPQLVVDRNNRVEIAFETNTSGYLVLADQNLPGWSATDNGRPVPILLANYLQRAVRVGPGKHRIVFEYQPPGFRAGCLITALAALLWLGLQALSRRSARVEEAAEAAELIPA